MLTLLLQTTPANHALGASLDWNAWIALVAFVSGGVISIGGLALRYGVTVTELKQHGRDIANLYDTQDEAAKISLQTSRNLDRLSDRFDNIVELLEAGVLPRKRGSDPKH